MLFHPLFLLLPLIAAQSQRPFASRPLGTEYNLVSEKLVREIDELRRDWGIHGAAVAVVRRGDDGSWEEDTFGLGVADSRGKAVTEDVSSSFLHSSVQC